MVRLLATLASFAALAAVLTADASRGSARAEPLTLDVQPQLVRWGTPVTLAGTIPGGAAGETVTIEAKECASPNFIGRAAAETTAGGRWVFPRLPVFTRTVLRAKWKGSRSAEVTVQARAGLAVAILSRGRFRVHVNAAPGRDFGGKRAVFERYEPTLGRWTRVRFIVLEEDGVTDVRASVRSKTLVRVVLPRSQASPCHLAGYSNLLRTS